MSRRIQGIKALIDILDESIEYATRIKTTYFDDSQEPGRNEGEHLVRDLQLTRRDFAQELAELEEEAEEAEEARRASDEGRE